MIQILIIVIGILLMPSISYAWGPLTHIYLGNEILSLAYLLPSAVYSLIKRYKEDFLYGNMIPDIIIGKKYLPQNKNSHSWKYGFNLLKNAQIDQQKAFAYGYLCHLAADTVAHEILTKEKKNIGHTIYELKADSIIKKKYWLQAVAIDKKVQIRNDNFLEDSISRRIFSFQTNKRIFKSVLFLSLFTSGSLSALLEKSLFFTGIPQKDFIKQLREKSLLRTIDIFENGLLSKVIKMDPAVKRKIRIKKPNFLFRKYSRHSRSLSARNSYSFMPAKSNRK